jgi:hypothetical protein
MELLKRCSQNTHCFISSHGVARNYLPLPLIIHIPVQFFLSIRLLPFTVTYYPMLPMPLHIQCPPMTHLLEKPHLTLALVCWIYGLGPGTFTVCIPKPCSSTRTKMMRMRSMKAKQIHLPRDQVILRMPILLSALAFKH